MSDGSDSIGNRCLLTVKEAAQWFGLSIYTLYYWAQARKIPHVKIGKRVMFSPDDLRRWLDEHKHGAVG